MSGFAGSIWIHLLLLALLPAGWRILRGRRLRLPYPRVDRLGESGAGRGVWLRLLGAWSPTLRTLSLLLIVATLIRSGMTVERIEEEREGVSIVVALDVSSSMLAEDFEGENRLQVAKRELGHFIDARGGDRIGLVAFAGEALTLVPGTLDHALLHQAVEDLGVGRLEDGTALGEALATAVNRATELGDGARTVVLLTDGDENAGAVRAEDAAAAARALGIRVHTVAVGRAGVSRIPVEITEEGIEYERREVRIGAPLLQAIAEGTGGVYFRADDPDALAGIYAQIDELETTPWREVRVVETARLPRGLLLATLLLLLLEAWGSASRARRVLVS